MTLDEIIMKAIPKETCALQESYNIERRKNLKARVNNKIEEAREEGRNEVRDKTQPYMPALEFKNG